MRILTVLFASFCIIGDFAVHADEPPAAPAQTATATPSAPPAVQAPATAVAAASNPGAATSLAPVTAATAAATAPVKSADTEAQIKKYRSMGFKPVSQNGTTVYCREEAVLGSRFSKRVCRTADDLDRASKEGVEETSTMQRLGNLPNSKN